MPYFHKGCNGEIGWKPPWPIPPRCKKCGKRWSPLVIYKPIPPKDMTFVVTPSPKKLVKEIQRQQTSYAKWGDKIPFVPSIAGRLPNWPRWARLITGLTFIGGMSFVAYLVFTIMRGILT